MSKRPRRMIDLLGLIHNLGHGLCSTVWIARDTRLGLHFSLKMLSANPESSQNCDYNNEVGISWMPCQKKIIRRWTCGMEICCFWASLSFQSGRAKREAPRFSLASLWTYHFSYVEMDDKNTEKCRAKDGPPSYAGGWRIFMEVRHMKSDKNLEGWSV